MKIIAATLFYFVFLSPIFSYSQEYDGRTVIGEEYAKNEIKKIMVNNTYEPFYDTLIKDKATAIKIAEPILFKTYGKKNIVRQRPYECYLIDGFWYINGTLPKNYLGGVFEIIINSKSGEVAKLIHSQ